MNTLTLNRNTTMLELKRWADRVVTDRVGRLVGYKNNIPFLIFTAPNLRVVK